MGQRPAPDGALSVAPSFQFLTLSLALHHSGTMDASFALALLDLDGVGRVTAGRVLEHFASYEALRDAPREQVLLRLKGAPHAERTVTTLFDDTVMGGLIKTAQDGLADLRSRHVEVLAPGHPHWPSGFEALSRSERPVVLYTFGNTAALAEPSVALLAREPLPTAPFETAQSLVRRLIEEGLAVAAGARPGFDVVVHKLCEAAKHPCVMVTRAGLAKLDGPARPSVAAAVRAGGVLVTSFPPTHGPFDHDDSERARLQVALARPSVFVAPRTDTPEARALDWALDAHRPVFSIHDDPPSEEAPPDSFSEHVHRITRPIDLDWVVAAARTPPDGPED